MFSVWIVNSRSDNMAFMKIDEFMSGELAALLIFVLAGWLTGCSSCSSGHRSDVQDTCGAETAETVVPHRFGFDPDTLAVYEGKVRRNEFFSNLLIRLGLEAQEAYELSMACDSVFDVRKLRSGNVFEAYYAAERPASGRNASVDDTDPVLSDSPASGEVSETAAPAGRRLDNIPKDMVPEYAEVTIKSSLWEDMLEAGVSPLLIRQLSDIYAWTVDFFALQKDDSFRVLYDEKSCDGRVVAVDTVRYAVFIHAGEEFPAIMFDQGDGGNIYWNAKGESMRKEFLKAPLQYSRISSGFSYARRHPITRRVQPHTGVDYAAPAGTPVMSIGDGKVISAKNEGAGGNTVRIRHNSVYTTAYLHLSRFASGIRAGVMVHQGDVIGYVGSTGRSTGPHLDFRVWKNGSPINPLKMESPPAEPLREENMPAFRALADSLGNVFHH